MPETLLSMLPARQAESSMVESQGQANGHGDPKPNARRTENVAKTPRTGKAKVPNRNRSAPTSAGEQSRDGGK